MGTTVRLLLAFFSARPHRDNGRGRRSAARHQQGRQHDGNNRCGDAQGARHGSHRSRSARSGRLCRREARVHHELQRRQRRRQQHFRGRPRGHEGAASDRSRRARPAPWHRARRREGLLHRRGREGRRPLRSRHAKSRLGDWYGSGPHAHGHRVERSETALHDERLVGDRQHPRTVHGDETRGSSSGHSSAGGGCRGRPVVAAGAPPPTTDWRVDRRARWPGRRRIRSVSGRQGTVGGQRTGWQCLDRRCREESGRRR